MASAMAIAIAGQGMALSSDYVIWVAPGISANAAGAERTVSIVGTDEVDLSRNHISWVSPLGRALMRSAAGDSVILQAPGGTEHLTVLEVRYERISVEPFREPPGSEESAKGRGRRPTRDEEETARRN